MEINNYLLVALLSSAFMLGMFASALIMVREVKNSRTLQRLHDPQQAHALNDRELNLITTISILIATAITAPAAYRRAIDTFLNSHSTAVVDNRIADIRDSHRRHIALLKADHAGQVRQHQQELLQMTENFDRVSNDHDWLSTRYLDQTHLVQELEDRIKYLEGKLQECGRSESNLNPPFSAPATRVRFDEAARRTGSDGGVSGDVSARRVLAVEEVD